ncbi:MAG: hypothetical protein K6A82_07045 [Prevotella sp.]|nr:hypothetical protein [Prevotella sp.]
MKTYIKPNSKVKEINGEADLLSGSLNGVNDEVGSGPQLSKGQFIPEDEETPVNSSKSIWEE